MHPFPKNNDVGPMTLSGGHIAAGSRPRLDDAVDGLMTDVIFKLRVNQLVSTLRRQQLDKESDTMLGMMESLVIAGEIPFTEFMQRVQNLFPHVFDQIDAELRENLLRMLQD